MRISFYNICEENKHTKLLANSDLPFIFLYYYYYQVIKIMFLNIQSGGHSELFMLLCMCRMLLGHL